MEQNVTTVKWNSGWSFLKTAPGTTFEQMQARRGDFAPVELPHDYLIYDANNLYEDSFGWYRKEFEIEDGDAEHYFLDFGGVYMDSTLYINGQSVGDWKYGYSSFEMEITDYLKAGRNEAVVLVRYLSPNTRWYSGAGIYRDVYLRKCGPSYLPTNGTYVHTTRCGGENAAASFELQIETELVVADADEATLVYLLSDRDGNLILRKSINVTDCGSCKEATTLTLDDAKLWSIDDPNCYDLFVLLVVNGEIVDEDRETVGMRTFEFDPDKGFFLNGKYVKLHGVCEHHDLGCLGAAVNVKALRRQFEVLRGMGVNALRTSHNMPDEAFMELADEMGFVVMTEAFDMWERPKTEYDYARFFIEWAGRDVESWVRRDRNHPSLLLWSIGNEIYDTHADAHGEEITRRLMGYVRESDPLGNAPITIGSNYMPWEGAQNCADIVKFAGYNYGEKYYEEHHAAHPDWIMYGSETASVVQSRGIYHFPYSQSILADEDEQCSSLGNSATSWGAASTTKCITDDRDATYTFGMFIWTGFDYIGEPTPYHTKNSYFGQIDTAGYPKDPYYLFKAEWTDVETQPMVHLYPYWDFNEGQLVDVCAVSNASEVELIVNGTSFGTQKIDHLHGEELVLHWQVPYAAGVIEAVAYEDGREVARDRRESFGNSAALRITCEETEIAADGRDLAFVTIETVDADSRLVENAVDAVTVTVSGPGRLIGLDNGDSTDYEQYKGCSRRLFSGKLLAVIAPTLEAGDIVVKASGAGLAGAECVIKSIETEECEVFTYLENMCDTAAKNGLDATPIIPVRKIELIAEGEHILTPEHKQTLIRAAVHPLEANDVKLIWKVVSDAGIEVPYAKLTPVSNDGASGETMELTALGDSDFRVRCMASDSKGKITVISQLEFKAEGIGTCCLNPYEFITAGLCTYRYGEIGNGNEKGISTARVGESGVAFEMVDFGEYGSDTITLPIFAHDDEYHIAIWKGKPFAEGARIIDEVIYRVPMIWNTYQAVTYKLKERFRGVETIGFSIVDKKIHLHGFSFEKQEKAYGLLLGSDCDRVYGDKFEIDGERIVGIGNNVTIEFGNMDFGAGCADAAAAGSNGASEAASGVGLMSVSICGRTPLPVNTIHIRFHKEDGTSANRMVEFAQSTEYMERTFEIEAFDGCGSVHLVFLPGCDFDFESIRFTKIP